MQLQGNNTFFYNSMQNSSHALNMFYVKKTFPSPQISDSRHIHVLYMQEVVLMDTAHTIYCTYHTVLQSTHYMQCEIQSHTVLMYSAGY